MARKSTIKLLLINESDNEGERLISLFRNAGRVARADRVTSAEDLHTKLEKNSWDLVIADDKHPEITVKKCLEQLKKLTPNLPIIVIRDDDQQAALDAGASDVVGIEDDQRLMFVAFREINHLEKHRQLDQIQSKLREAEERCELLLAQSQDAIAYCADGMIISANPLFCNRFGYDDPDDLDCLPIIDLIDKNDHNKIKNLLKTQMINTDQDHAVGAELAFTGVCQNADTFSATMQLSNAVLDDEPCIQLSVREEITIDTKTIKNDSASSANKEPLTGLLSRDYFLNQLRSEATQAKAGNTSSTLIFIGIDKFTAFRSKWGITHTNSVVLDIAKFIHDRLSETHLLAHFCDDGFTLLLPETNSEKALSFSKSLCSDLEQHIIEIDGQSIQCTISAGLVVLDKQSQVDPNKLVEQAFSTSDKVRKEAKGGEGNGALIFVPTKEIKTLGGSEGDDDLDRTLEEALEDKRFALVYQPVVSLRGTSGDHYEVEARLINESGSEVRAEEYLKTLTFTTPNTRLDRWIIIESTKQLAIQHANQHDTRLFINLTSNALIDESLIPWLNVALKAGGISPESLIFQFFESDIINCLKPAKAFTEAIRALGCQLSINQFGQVGDPFNTLKHVEADFAKISRSFTQQLQDGGDTQALKTMVTNINEHKSEAIISNVENASALAVLWQLGVDYIQGNYLAAPAKEMDYEFTDIA